jgi:hypothetical protein
MVVRILQRNPTILTTAVVIVISLALFSVFSISSLSNSMYIQTIHKAVAQQAAETDNQTAAGNATSLSNTTSPSGNATDNMSAAQAAAKREIPKTATEGWEEG